MKIQPMKAFSAANVNPYMVSTMFHSTSDSSVERDREEGGGGGGGGRGEKGKKGERGREIERGSDRERGIKKGRGVGKEEREGGGKEGERVRERGMGEE